MRSYNAKLETAWFLGRLILFALMNMIVFEVPTAAASNGKYLVYIGTYTQKDSKGIYAYRFEAASGKTTPLGLVAATENPSFLAVHPGGRFLYAVNEVNKFKGKASGALSAYRVDRKTGQLRLLNQVSSLGAGPAHVSIDKTGKYALTANYDGGSVAAFPIREDGRLGEATAFVQHAGFSVNRQRQAGPHAHAINVSNDNRYAVVADLGLDELLVYRFDSAKGSLTPSDSKFAKTDPGAGPRHVAFHPNGKFVYANNEMQSTVTSFSYDAEPGVLDKLQTLSTLPKDFTGHNDTAEIVVDAKGRFLYVSNRGHNSIAVFAINPKTGTLSPIEHVGSGGKTPRNLALDPTGAWLFAANQDSNNIVLFHVDQKVGRLTPTQQQLKVSAPVCVVFAPLEH